MPGQFYVVGKIEISNTKRSFKVYLLDSNGTWVFLGLVPFKALAKLTRKEIDIIDICAFSQSPTQEPLIFPEVTRP